MLPRVVNVDQTYSVRQFLKTAFEVPPTGGRTGGVVLFHMDLVAAGAQREEEPI
jgi:hypothetical protein